MQKCYCLFQLSMHVRDDFVTHIFTANLSKQQNKNIKDKSLLHDRDLFTKCINRKKLEESLIPSIPVLACEAMLAEKFRASDFVC